MDGGESNCPDLPRIVWVGARGVLRQVNGGRAGDAATGAIRRAPGAFTRRANRTPLGWSGCGSRSRCRQSTRALWRLTKSASRWRTCAAALSAAGEHAEAVRLQQDIPDAETRASGPEHRNTLISASNWMSRFWASGSARRRRCFCERRSPHEPARSGRATRAR